ncbi:uncharacterized protein LOC129706561 [Leucoraja erinacea]|uniref:uncharacterized protein LOC129706561 n=1 Tax=Leucoraja erinaceus TaxID=7782 RepID=UPI0024577201|nr:uncharacterized protein LOC129706561 [Leucoraja erinacea]
MLAGTAVNDAVVVNQLNEEAPVVEKAFDDLAQVEVTSHVKKFPDHGAVLDSVEPGLCFRSKVLYHFRQYIIDSCCFPRFQHAHCSFEFFKVEGLGEGPPIDNSFSRLQRTPSSWTSPHGHWYNEIWASQSDVGTGVHSQWLGLPNWPLPTGDRGSRSPQAELGGDSRWRPSAKGSQGSAILKSAQPEPVSSVNHSSMILKQQAQHSRASNGNPVFLHFERRKGYEDDKAMKLIFITDAFKDLLHCTLGKKQEVIHSVPLSRKTIGEYSLPVHCTMFSLDLIGYCLRF